MHKLDLLRSIPIFARLPDAHLGLLAAGLGSQLYERGETIFHQGSAGHTPRGMIWVLGIAATVGTLLGAI